ncbi:hypothetical protein SLA2020_375430 [Shorea laevis]
MTAHPLRVLDLKIWWQMKWRILNMLALQCTNLNWPQKVTRQLQYRVKGARSNTGEPGRANLDMEQEKDQKVPSQNKTLAEATTKPVAD